MSKASGFFVAEAVSSQLSAFSNKLTPHSYPLPFTLSLTPYPLLFLRYFRLQQYPDRMQLITVRKHILWQ